MEVSVAEAARILGLSERQVQYGIKRGKYQARKDGRSWVVTVDDGAKSEGQRLADATKEEKVRHVTEDVLSRKRKGSGGDDERFTVFELRAMKAGGQLLATLRAGLDEGHPATIHLRECLALVACGVHEFTYSCKAEFLRRAREQACRAMVALVFDCADDRAEHVAVFEEAVLPAIGGLLRRAESRRQP